MKNLIIALLLFAASLAQAQLSSMQSVKEIATVSHPDFTDLAFFNAFLIEGYVYLELDYGHDGYIINSGEIVHRNPPNTVGLLEISNNRVSYLTTSASGLQIVEVDLTDTSKEPLVSGPISTSDFGYRRFDYYGVEMSNDNPNWDPLIVIYSGENTFSIYQLAAKTRGQWVYSSSLEEWIWVFAD